MHELQSIHPNQNQKQITRKRKEQEQQQQNTRSVKKNKSNFINVIEDKFAMSIR